MGQEIERKFLINEKKWQQVDKPKGEHYRQGYILTDPYKTIRVRQTADKGYLTIKGITIGTTRQEYEYEIPMDEAKELLDNFSVAELSKIRYKVEYRNRIWEVDEFLGDNLGLLIVEIELSSEDEIVEIPDWVGMEVTDQVKYYNSNLTIEPFKNWKAVS